MNFKSALTLGLITVMLAVGVLMAATPKDDFICEEPLRLVVKPHEFTENHLAYCVMELGMLRRYGPRPETSTGECRATRKDADAVRDTLAQTRQEAFQACLATRASPPVATWNFAKRLWARVSG